MTAADELLSYCVLPTNSVLGTTGLQELEGLARHALFREYPPYAAEAPLQPQVMAHAAHTHTATPP